MEDLFKKFVNAGVGYLSQGNKKVQATVDKLVKDSKLTEQEGKKIVDELMKSGETKRAELEKQFRSLTERMMSTVGVGGTTKKTTSSTGKSSGAKSAASGSKAGGSKTAAKASSPASKAAGATKKAADSVSSAAGTAQKSAAARAGAAKKPAAKKAPASRSTGSGSGSEGNS
jgi:polyhydroxyalkanoate synthesis regulator phasin